MSVKLDEETEGKICGGCRRAEQCADVDRGYPEKCGILLAVKTLIRETEQQAEEKGRRDVLKENKKIFEFIYNRLLTVHGENPIIDYMIAFEKAIKGE